MPNVVRFPSRSRVEQGERMQLIEALKAARELRAVLAVLQFSKPESVIHEQAQQHVDSVLELITDAIVTAEEL